MVDIAFTLNKAADIIEERGWTVEKLIDDRGCVCAEGAVLMALGAPLESLYFAPPIETTEAAIPVYEALLNYLDDHGTVNEDGGLFSFVSEWNDECAHDQDEVVTTLRAAAREVA